MTVSFYEDPFTRLESKAQNGRMQVAGWNELLWDHLEEVMQERWQAKLLGLEEWICELLIKNEQLRMTLMEMQAREPQDNSGR